MKPYQVNYWVLGENKGSVTMQDIMSDGVNPELPHRWFIDTVGVRTEIPYAGMAFKFGKERSENIAEARAAQAAAK